MCPRCAAMWHDGRWRWSEFRPAGAEHICPACRRIDDHYPAGVVTLAGAFLAQHKDELLNLARHQESLEKSEHPMNRIMSLREAADTVVINTTDIHLPRRIGKALKQAYKGSLEISFDEDAYFTRVEWRRD